MYAHNVKTFETLLPFFKSKKCMQLLGRRENRRWVSDTVTPTKKGCALVSGRWSRLLEVMEVYLRWKA